MSIGDENGELVIYTGNDGKPKIDVRFQDETVWLSQKQLAELYGTTKQNISQHVKNIFAEGELQANSVVKNYLTTAADGKSYDTEHYNLDMIISLGYRITSGVATTFRILTTQRT